MGYFKNLQIEQMEASYPEDSKHKGWPECEFDGYPYAFDVDAQEEFDDWTDYEKEEQLGKIDDSSFLDKLGLDEDELAYAKYQWEKSEEEDRKRGII